MDHQPADSVKGDWDSVNSSTSISASNSATDSNSNTNCTPVASTTTGIARLHLCLGSEGSERHVSFHVGVIDNEGMNRHKSKCCCIYRKPYAFDESSSSSDDETDHCYGHPEVKKMNRFNKHQRCAAGCSCCGQK
ncbi:E3 ubiquitin-protein ligase PPP1R11 [Drosophila tropicalis]|uniref:E3 ubiquitin-protein ligase PPP1R11 n=1 Tax=Drosophila tropicalis TaxID=46794 RepID=UPI0035AB9575